MSSHSGGAGGGPGDPPEGIKEINVNALTSAKVGGSQVEKKKVRTFQQILAEEKENRNILEIKIRRLNVSILIFDVLKLNPEDCKGVALVTSRYDNKEVKLKDDVDPSIYVHNLSTYPVQRPWGHCVKTNYKCYKDLQNQQRGDKEDKSKKEQEKKNTAEHPIATAVAKIVIEHTNEIIEYDAEHDRVLTKNEEEMNRLMEEHCQGKKDKEKKMTPLKNQVLEKIRIFERDWDLNPPEAEAL